MINIREEFALTDEQFRQRERKLAENFRDCIREGKHRGPFHLNTQDSHAAAAFCVRLCDHCGRNKELLPDKGYSDEELKRKLKLALKGTREKTNEILEEGREAHRKVVDEMKRRIEESRIEDEKLRELVRSKRKGHPKG
jgi:hypothetical protein